MSAYTVRAVDIETDTELTKLGPFYWKDKAHREARKLSLHMSSPTVIATVESEGLRTVAYRWGRRYKPTNQ